MGRKLINYLPEVLRNYREFQKTFEAEESELLKVQEELSKVLDDLFVEDATERGVKRWENILGIVPKPSENLEDRKFKILSKLVKKLPYTRRRLEQLLEVLCGENGYLLEIVEGTTNIYKDASEFPGDITDSSGTLTVEEYFERYNGNKVMRLIKTEGEPNPYTSFGRGISINPDSFYTLHCKAKMVYGGDIQDRFGCRWRGSGLDWEQIIPLGNGWFHCIRTFSPAGVDSSNTGFRVKGNSAMEVLVTEPQLEPMRYDTPFVDGTRLYNYIVKVRVALARKNMFNDVKILLQEIIPANHIVDLSLLYNQHFTVGQYKHGELSTWTHNYIRNEVLNQ